MCGGPKKLWEKNILKSKFLKNAISYHNSRETSLDYRFLFKYFTTNVDCFTGEWKIIVVTELLNFLWNV